MKSILYPYCWKWMVKELTLTSKSIKYININGSIILFPLQCGFHQHHSKEEIVYSRLFPPSIPIIRVKSWTTALLHYDICDWGSHAKISTSNLLWCGILSSVSCKREHNTTFPPPLPVSGWWRLQSASMVAAPIRRNGQRV